MTESAPYGWHASSDPVAYEQACLDAVRRSLTDFAEHRENAFVPTIIKDIRLRGSYPETELVIDLTRDEQHGELAWKLHGDDFGTRQAPGYQEYPEGVVQQVYVQVAEFGR